MTQPREIVVCSRPPTSQLLLEMTRPLAGVVTAVETPDQVIAALRTSPALVVLDFDSLGDSREPVWQAVEGSRSASKVLVVAAAGTSVNAGELFLRFRIKNLLARNGDIHPSDFRMTVNKILTGEIFGLEKYLSPGRSLREQPIRGSADKPACLDAVADFAREHGLHPRLVDQLVSVADEMVTNAVFNAPVDREGRRRYATRHRLDHVELEPGEQSLLRLAADESRLALSVTDPFGTLDGDRVVDYLAKCFRRGSDQVDAKPGGAGLGLYMIFEALSHFVINIATGVRTELIGVVDMTGSYREFAKRSKSFNLFVEGELHV